VDEQTQKNVVSRRAVLKSAAKSSALLLSQFYPQPQRLWMWLEVHDKLEMVVVGEERSMTSRP
jgi:hypothetical protein